MPIPLLPNAQLFSGGVSPNARGLCPGGRVLYVGNRTGTTAGNGKSPDRPYATLSEAVTQLATNLNGNGDCVYILPGHSENVDAADWMSELSTLAGLSICGLGTGTARGTFNWSVEAATLLLDTANLELANLNLFLATGRGTSTAATVAAPITVSAAGCRIVDCYINFGIDADQIVTVGITTTAAADDFEFLNNVCEGAVAAEVTAAGTFLRLVGADRAHIAWNFIAGALATDTDGLIETLTTLSDQLNIHDNFISAQGSGNTCAIDFGAALACTGRLERNLLVVDTDATAETVVFTRNAANNMALLDNFLVNNNNERGLVIGTASV